MAPSETLRRLSRRARRVYETARLRRALTRAWPVPIAILVAARLSGSHGSTWALGMVLFVAAVGFVWRGGALERGVLPGLLAGGVPLVLPALAVGSAQACSASCALWCAVSCVCGGLIAGLAVGFRAAEAENGRTTVLAAGTLIAATTGAMGCSMAGAMGVAGMAVGFVVGTVPAFLWVPRRT